MGHIPQKTTSEAIRLQKFLADAGICSRRAAEELIREGRVKVDGRPAELGQRVIPGQQRVMVGRRTIRPQTRQLTLMMHKPRGAVCSNDDPHAKVTVFDMLPPSHRELRLFCAGRLDKESDGLIILTNDGALAHRLTHPSNQVVKRYRVTLSKPFDPKHLPLLLKGAVVEGEELRADRVIPAERGDDANRRLEIHLGHGRKREIRRLLEHYGYFVKRLTRFQIGALRLKGLGPGQARPLSVKERQLLFEI